tara:strand:- start:11003 stop:11191 length:189 start_codon:yes stop_codon:yes gene_type:complete
MISYAPFENEKPVVVHKPQPVPQPARRKIVKSKIPTMEGTECNYVVLVFLIGIIYLLITTAD